MRGTIVGHTDNEGDEENNRALSQARADTVMHYLIGRGVEAERLSAEGVGSDQPVEDNATQFGRARNRRVEFRLGAAPADK